MYTLSGAAALRCRRARARPRRARRRRASPTSARSARRAARSARGSRCATRPALPAPALTTYATWYVTRRPAPRWRPEASRNAAAVCSQHRARSVRATNAEGRSSVGAGSCHVSTQVKCPEYACEYSGEPSRDARRRGAPAQGGAVKVLEYSLRPHSLFSTRARFGGRLRGKSCAALRCALCVCVCVSVCVSVCEGVCVCVSVVVSTCA